jgi:hypothetical protein
VTQNTWYHLAAVYKDTTVSIYVNGTLSGSRNDAPASHTCNIERESNFFGMADNTSSSRAEPLILNSLLDEIKLFNKALTLEEIMLDMNAKDGIAPGIC